MEQAPEEDMVEAEEVLNSLPMTVCYCCLRASKSEAKMLMMRTLPTTTTMLANLTTTVTTTTTTRLAR
ncbi:hypothetical protein ACLKA7_015204 [Drosophila subpalustris]